MNNKDFIKIDDLFKGKPDMEEQIPAGAWRNMQDLIDKAAVAGRGAGGRRYGLYALLALFTVGLGAGAVSLQYSQLSSNVSTSTNLSNSEIAIAARNAANSETIHTNNSTTPSTSATNVSHVNNAVANQKASNSIVSNNNSTVANENSNNTNKIATRKSKNNNPKATVTNIAETQNNQSYNSLPVVAQNSKKQKANQTNRNQTNSIANSDVAMLESIQSNNVNQAVIATPIAIASNMDLAIDNIDKSKFAPTNTADGSYQAVVQDDNNKFVAIEGDNVWKKEVLENVHHVKQSVHYSKDNNGAPIKQIDTISQTHYKRKALVALSDNDKQALVYLTSAKPGVTDQMKPMLDAESAASKVAFAAGANANSALVPLSNYKVKSIESTDKKHFAARFYDMMSDYLNGGKPYYFGAGLGAQAHMSQPLQNGFHLGLGGYYDFKERYTLGVELRYLYGSFNNQTYSDPYKIYTDQSVDQSGNSPVFNALEQKFVNNYQLRSMSHIEIPITLRYQLSKISILGGFLGSYSSALSHTVTQAQAEGDATRVTGAQRFQNTAPQAVANDFKSRFGMGFTLGAGYDFSKNFSVDLRINQTLWNSLSGTSDLSRMLYRSTGVQVSLLYYIGKKDKVIYMMAPKK